MTPRSSRRGVLTRPRDIIHGRALKTPRILIHQEWPNMVPVPRSCSPTNTSQCSTDHGAVMRRSMVLKVGRYPSIPWFCQPRVQQPAAGRVQVGYL